MEISFRPFEPTDADYATLVSIHNAIWPEYTEQTSDWRHWDEQRPEHCTLERWVVERGGDVIAFGQFFQVPWMYHPRKFFIYIDVHPDHQSQGVGRRIYEHLIERLAPHNPIALRTDTREDQLAAMQFIASRGFEEEMRSWESRLDLTSFDPRPWAGHETQVLAKGVRIATLRELLGGGEEFKRRHYEAMVEMARDVPRPDEYTPMPFEAWAKAHYDDPNLLPEAYFVALHDGEIAAVSQLWRNSGDPSVLNTGLTATRRDFRRMGIALALKLRAIAYARSQGIREIRTGNESNNRPMLSINEALGFIKQPAWVNFVKTLKEE